MSEIPVVTLCGSTKFKTEFRDIEKKLTLAGFAVLSLGFFEKSDAVNITKQQERLFGDIHLKKIDLADEILVIDVDGYIGESTQKEIDYAKEKSKKVSFYSQKIMMR